MQVAFYLAGEITQVLDPIPWVRCASGNVFQTGMLFWKLGFHWPSVFDHQSFNWVEKFESLWRSSTRVFYLQNWGLIWSKNLIKVSPWNLDWNSHPHPCVADGDDNKGDEVSADKIDRSLQKWIHTLYQPRKWWSKNYNDFYSTIMLTTRCEGKNINIFKKKSEKKNLEIWNFSRNIKISRKSDLQNSE